MQQRLIWFKGAMIPVEEARVSALSPSAQYGLTVFEGIRCYASMCNPDQVFAFRLREHFERLLDSCKLIGLTAPYSADELQDYLIQTVRANAYREDLAVRMTVFVDGEGSWSSEGPADMFISTSKRPRSSVDSPQGRSACISTWERINDNCFPPRVKAGGNYLNARYAQLEARRHGYDLPLFLGRSGKLTEGGGACMFMIRRGVLTTPTLTSSVLESITRSTILTLAHGLGIPTAEREIDRTELYLAEELFLCGSAAELTPITSVDGLPIGSGLPGPQTLRLLRAYLDAASNPLAGHSDWRVPIY